MKKTNNNKSWRRCEEKEPSSTVGTKAQPLWKSPWSVLKNLKVRYTTWSGYSTLDLPKGLHITPQRYSYIHVHCMIERKWDQLRCPSTGEWPMKMWRIYKIEFYSAVKQKEIMEFTGKWMEMENITVNELNPGQGDRHCTFSLICRSKL